MNQPLVSVIMAVYNAEKYVAESIKSVLNQTYDKLQFIIINDGSNDRSPEIICDFSDARIEYYSLAENHHIAYATNIGFSKAKGYYIAIMDSDDLWQPDKLEKQVKYLQSHPEHEGCFTWVDLIDEDNHSLNEQMAELRDLYAASTESQEYWLRFFFFYGNRLNNPSSLITYAAFQKIGYHNLFYQQAPDMEWWVRFAQNFTFGIIEEPLIKYRRGTYSDLNNSAYSDIKDTRFYNEHMYIRYHLLENLEDDLFIRAFKPWFHCTDSCTPEELICEKAFLLCLPINNSTAYSALGLLKLEELLADQHMADLLQNRYQLSTIKCGEYTGTHLFNDLILQKYPSKIKDLEKWLNLTQLHIQKLEDNIEKQYIQKSAEVTALKNTLQLQNQEIQHLTTQLDSMLHSKSWKLTTPLRFIGSIIHKSISPKNNQE